MSDRHSKPFVEVKNGRMTERPWTPEGQLLLVEAFELFGEMHFGDAWTGDESSARRGIPNRPEPPRRPSPDSVVNVKDPNGKTREVRNAVRYRVDGRLVYLPYEDALQRYEGEKVDLMQQWEALCAAHQRYRDVEYRFRQVLNAGHVTASVLQQSGYTTRVPKSIWSGNGVTNVFETGKARFSAGDSYFPVKVDGTVIVPEHELQAYFATIAESVGEGTEDKSEVQQPSDSSSDGEVISTPVPSAAGRPTKYDWEGCWVEMSRITYFDGLPKTQAEMVGMLQDWFIGQIGTAPTDSEIKKRVSKLFRAIQEADNS